MFCTECGSNNSDQAIKCSNCGHSFEGAQSTATITQSLNPTHSYTSMSDTGGNFVSKLICQSTYSTARAKWFCQTAEKIVNIIVWIVILIGGAFTLFLMSQSLGAGMLNLVFQLFGFIFAFVMLIFAKLGLMALGALIHISELVETNQKR